MPWRRVAIVVAVVLAGLIALGRFSDILVDWLWFSSIGYVEVFWTIFTTQAVLFFTVFAASAGALWLSGRVALHYAERRGSRPWSAASARPLPETLPEIFGWVSP